MAKAIRNPAKPAITEIIVQAVDETVTLTMSKKEAETLRLVCRRVGGHPDTTRRGDMDSIKDALGEAGVKDLHDPICARARARSLKEIPLTGHLYFEELV